MKFRWEKKYLYWGVTALLVVIGGLLAYYLIFHGGNFKDHLAESAAHLHANSGRLYSGMADVSAGKRHRAFCIVSRQRLADFPKTVLTEKKETADQLLPRHFDRPDAVLCPVFGVRIFRVVIPQIIGSIQSIAGQFPSYVKNVSDWAEKLLADNPDIETTVSDLIDHYSTDLENFLNKTMMPQINAIVKTVSLSMLSFAKAIWNLIIGLIISIYLLASKERFVSQGKKLLYAFWDTRQANVIMEDFRLIDSTFGGFISGKILDSAIIGVLCFVVVSIMKMPYPMLISVIVGVTNIIPFFGPFIGAVPCALLILMVNPMQCLYFIIFIWILQQFDGNFLGPKILGDSTGLSGFWIIFSITIFSGLMGVPGMILGVPIFAVFYALIKRYVNRSLQKKGMSDKTEEYQTLDYVDVQTGSFISKPEDKPARHRKKQFSFRNFKEDLKTFIPHPTEHVEKNAETAAKDSAGKDNQKQENSELSDR